MSDGAITAIVTSTFYLLIVVITWSVCTFFERRKNKKDELAWRKEGIFVPSHIPAKQVDKYRNAKMKQEDACSEVCYD